MTLILKNGTLIDGTGQAPHANATVIVDHGNGPVARIAKVLGPGEPMVPFPPEATVLDCRDKFILPGLIDAHVHLAFCAGEDHPTTVHQVVNEAAPALALRELRNAQECLLAGITTVRDCGDRHNTTFLVRDAINQGLLTGPRILASGMPLTITFGHLCFCGLEVEGVDAVKIAVRQQAKAGADHIKVMVTGGIMTGNVRPLLCQYSQSELSAICAEAQRLDKRVAAHVGSVEGVRRCIAAGVTSIEHCGWGNADGSSGYDPRLVEAMVERDIFVGQTVAGVSRNVLLPEATDSDADRQRMLEKAHDGWATARSMHAAGVKMMLSSDAGVRNTPFRDIDLSLRFFQMMMDVSPLETLRCITQVPAEGLGLADRLGTVATGKVADLLVLDADPLHDLRNMRSIRWVIKEGAIVVDAGKLVV
jgi:imidazolonepropionase-like amidohydrolase